MARPRWRLLSPRLWPRHVAILAIGSPRRTRPLQRQKPSGQWRGGFLVFVLLPTPRHFHSAPASSAARLRTAHCTLRTAHCTLRTAPCTRAGAPCTLHPAPCTLRTAHPALEEFRSLSGTPRSRRVVLRTFVGTGEVCVWTPRSRRAVLRTCVGTGAGDSEGGHRARQHQRE